MTFPTQKTFGEFIRERHGRNWVYAARSTPRILARYQKYNPDTGEHEPPAVITPKQQRQLKIDYAKAWGREYDPQYWQMLCSLRDLVALHRNQGNSHGLCTPAVIATDLAFETIWHSASGERRAAAILFLRGRLHFHHADGTRAPANAGAPSMLVAYGNRDAAILEGCALPGQFIAL